MPLCTCLCVYGCFFGLWLRSSRWLPSGFCTCFELETGGRGAHCHFISSGIPAPSHVYTNYCCLLMGSVCAPSLLITPHRNTSTVISFWHDISNNMPYTVMHGNRRHVCSGDSCFSRPYAAACFYHLSPLLISLEKLLFILS